MDVRNLGAHITPIPETKGLKFKLNGREKTKNPPIVKADLYKKLIVKSFFLKSTKIKIKKVSKR